GGDAELEVDGLEAGGAAEEVEGEAEVLDGGEGLAVAEEIGVVGGGGAGAFGDGDAAGLEESLGGAGEVEEEVAAGDWVVAFEGVAVEGVEAAGACVDGVEAGVFVA